MPERIDTSSGTRQTLLCLNLGQTEYTRVLELQQDIVHAKNDQVLRHDRVILTEHAPVFTVGKHGGEENLVCSRKFLKERGVDLVHTTRGGNITYHGPGQIILYPILDLERSKTGVREFVSLLEEVMLDTVLKLGVKASRSSRNPGIWVGDAKLGSIGISLKKGVSFHGLALNVNPDLTPFKWINPCGMNDISVTSAANELKKRDLPMPDLSFEKVATLLVASFEKVFGARLQYSDTQLMPQTGIHARKKGKPTWLRTRLPRGEGYEKTRTLLSAGCLHTVCQGANCPNKFECYGRGTATFMILGDRCTRNCRFCNVPTGDPGPPDPEEPARVARAASEMNLSYVVITSVTRDDLEDGGAFHFARTVDAVKKISGGDTAVEVLIPDFRGKTEHLETVLKMIPAVLNHNIETVPSLYKTARPQAIYERSLELLSAVSKTNRAIPAKSGIMVGLGETFTELYRTMADLVETGCSILTVGQYLQPTKAHLPVKKYYTPEEFAEIEAAAVHLGFRRVASGPLVRSSYKAEELSRLPEAPRILDSHL